jgi:glycosyltransferase involved in cell wall biosynthesis
MVLERVRTTDVPPALAKHNNERTHVRILNLNTSPGFEDNVLWQSHSIPITSLDQSWPRRSLLGKAKKLLGVSRTFDVVLFHLDMRLAAVYGLLRLFVSSKQRLIFQSFLCDVSRYSSSSGSITTLVRNNVSLLLHHLLVRTMNLVIVHTRAEVGLYSRFFRVPASRFAFIPYFHYGGSCDYPTTDFSKANYSDKRANILAIGRHRDFACFILAMTGSPWDGMIIAGDSDRGELDGNVPANLPVLYEVTRTEYRDYIARSTIVVIPLYPDRWQRALGQIAMFEAMLMLKPVIAAETFQLTDYASENEVLFYRPGDADHLREQICRLLEDEDLRDRLARNARTRLLTEFTRERYVSDLVDTCQTACACSRA